MYIIRHAQSLRHYTFSRHKGIPFHLKQKGQATFLGIVMVLHVRSL